MAMLTIAAVGQCSVLLASRHGKPHRPGHHTMMRRALRRLHPIAGALGSGAYAGGLWSQQQHSPARCSEEADTSGRWMWPAGAATGSELQQACLGQDGKQFEHRMPCAHVQTGSFGFLLYLPEGYRSSKAPAGGWPVIFHLHGGGESENQQGFGPLTKHGVNLLSAVKAHGLPAIVESTGSSANYIVVSPQCPEGGRGWGSEPAQAALTQLADLITAELNVDPARLYLTGLSMGGYGSWSWAAAEPQRFAAIAPVCGGWRDDATRDAMIQKIKHIPHWVAHGANDKIVPVARSDEMVEALKAAGAPAVVYKRYPISPAPFQPTDWSERRSDGSEGAPLAPKDLTGHDSWTQTYTDAEFFVWLLAQKRANEVG